MPTTNTPATAEAAPVKAQTHLSLFAQPKMFPMPAAFFNNSFYRSRVATNVTAVPGASVSVPAYAKTGFFAQLCIESTKASPVSMPPIVKPKPKPALALDLAVIEDYTEKVSPRSQNDDEDYVHIVSPGR
jgi:hypothetical protein